MLFELTVVDGCVITLDIINSLHSAPGVMGRFASETR